MSDIPIGATHYNWFGQYFLREECDGTFSFYYRYKGWEPTAFKEDDFGCMIRRV